MRLDIFLNQTFIKYTFDQLKRSEGGMGCNSRETLTEEQLSAAIDGQASDNVLEHLASCPICSARLALARTAETTMRTRLYRFDCPSSQELTDYHMGLVNSTTDRQITRHLALCVTCQAEIETLRSFMHTDHPYAHLVAPTQAAPSLSSALHDLIASILPPTPQLALRGNSLRNLTARAGSTTLMLVPERDKSGQLTLAGQILDDDIDQWIGAQVEIYHNEHISHSSMIDELGGFALHAIPSETITLRVIPHKGRAIKVPALDL